MPCLKHFLLKGNSCWFRGLMGHCCVAAKLRLKKVWNESVAKCLVSVEDDVKLMAVQTWPFSAHALPLVYPLSPLKVEAYSLRRIFLPCAHSQSTLHTHAVAQNQYGKDMQTRILTWHILTKPWSSMGLNKDNHCLHQWTEIDGQG